jgi:hypothetical protein
MTKILGPCSERKRISLAPEKPSGKKPLKALKNFLALVLLSREAVAHCHLALCLDASYIRE